MKAPLAIDRVAAGAQPSRKGLGAGHGGIIASRSEARQRMTCVDVTADLDASGVRNINEVRCNDLWFDETRYVRRARV